MRKPCRLEECEKVSRAWGLCKMHYVRLKTHGSTDKPQRRLSAQDRFWAKVDKTSSPKGCWLWTAAKNQDGYGSFWLEPRMRGAHKVAYEWLVGPVPLELPYLDHMCHDVSCVNPSHLRPVTSKQNQENRPRLNKNNKSGYRGVSLHAASGKWLARVGHHGTEQLLGLFDDVHEAGAVALAKRLELQTHNDYER